MIHSILVKDYMDHNPHAISETASLAEAVELLSEYCVMGAPVVDENANVVGFISEQDCIQELLNDSYYYEDPPSVTKMMSSEVISFSSNSSILEVAQFIIDKELRNFPVVDNGKLVGMITRNKILKALIDARKDIFHKTA